MSHFSEVFTVASLILILTHAHTHTPAHHTRRHSTVYWHRRTVLESAALSEQKSEALLHWIHPHIKEKSGWSPWIFKMWRTNTQKHWFTAFCIPNQRKVWMSFTSLMINPISAGNPDVKGQSVILPALSCSPTAARTFRPTAESRWHICWMTKVQVSVWVLETIGCSTRRSKQLSAHTDGGWRLIQ